MLRFPSWLGDDLEAMTRDCRDRLGGIPIGMRFLVVVLLLVFDPDRLSIRLDDLGDLDLGRLAFASHADLVAFLKPDELDGLRPDVSEIFHVLALDDETMSE